MPAIPPKFNVIDWRQRALDFDKLTFDINASGDNKGFLPITKYDANLRAWTMPAYVGPLNPGGNEAVAYVASVLGSTYAGIDKSSGSDWVANTLAWFSGTHEVFTNNINGQTGGSFWYSMFPNLLFMSLVDRYPQKENLVPIMQRVAKSYYDAALAIKGSAPYPSFDCTDWNIATKTPFTGTWKEPDGAAGFAWMMYMAYLKFNDPRYLEAAKWGLSSLAANAENPYYEVLFPFGVYTAVRMNAEIGSTFDTKKLMNWVFFSSPSPNRREFSMGTGTWGGYPNSGVILAVNYSNENGQDPSGGAGWPMNTFAWGQSLVPIARYDSRYAKAIGKWMLNAASSVRFAYPDSGLPVVAPAVDDWTGDPKAAIPFEYFLHKWTGHQPYKDISMSLGGDPRVMSWPFNTGRGVYSGALVGAFGGIIGRSTGVPEILQLDLLATEPFTAAGDGKKPFPSYLYYNPHSTKKTISINVGSAPVTLYDTVQHKVLKSNATNVTSLDIDADSAMVVVAVPSTATVEIKNQKLWANGVVVDYALSSK